MTPLAWAARLSRNAWLPAPQFSHRLTRFIAGRARSSRQTRTLLLLKTTTDQLPALESRLQELHSYETPEFLVIEIEAGSKSYLKWLSENLGAQPGTKV
jgi:hypothetical protein